MRAVRAPMRQQHFARCGIAGAALATRWLTRYNSASWLCYGSVKRGKSTILQFFRSAAWRQQTT